jgi:hypothetical protein
LKGLAWEGKGEMVEDLGRGFLKAQACRTSLERAGIRRLSQQRQAQGAMTEYGLVGKMPCVEDHFRNPHRVSLPFKPRVGPENS